eukprot:TRINITY_DN91514_c0_g1_i1.p1 TRINITY_DN91514_c0_g1~~TRINITY_DN91514_c0_g1_i1.p1  ORF type:complete len:363 (-),score=68.91 TRINITY_DN91514_c0_g1_i1:61-1149(-)
MEDFSTKLHSKGFTIVRKLQASAACSILSVVKDGQTSAAKVVNLAGLDDQGRLHADQEVSFLKGIGTHPNLISYLESFLMENRLVIIMSLAENGDLRCVVKELQASPPRRIPEPLILSWLHQTLAGLSFMHSQAVMHRDLKTSNIFLSAGRRRLQIGDFGISRMLESMTHAESCVGTPAYMAPEIMRNENYDFHADMWAVGCITYELCTLKMPFKTESLLELFIQVTEAEPAWSDFNTYSDDLLDLTKRLLSKTALDRPGSTELLSDPSSPWGPQALEAVPEELWKVVEPLEEESSAVLPEGKDGKADETWSTRAGSDATSPGGYGTKTTCSPGSHSTLEMAFDLSVGDFQKRLAESDMAQA